MKKSSLRNRAMSALLVFGFLAATTAQAGSTAFVPIQQRAQGESLAGSDLMNDSLYANPASSAFTNVYSIDGTFMAPRTFAVSILDTKTSAMGGGIGFYRQGIPGTNRFNQGGRLAVMSRLSENIGIGITGKMTWGPNNAGVDTRYTDMDLGLITHFDSLQFGFAIQNVFDGNASMGERREYALGGRVNWEQTVFFSAAMNGMMSNFNPTQFGFGAEYSSPYYFSLKGGYRIRPNDNKSFWSAGVSINSPKASLHYAVEFPNQSVDTVTHTVGTSVLF